jgi:hypoxanthine phosphoribosyltransferase
MPAATTRNRRTRRSSSRQTGDRKPAAERASPASPAAVEAPPEDKTEAKARTTRRGTRGGRGRTRTAANKTSSGRAKAEESVSEPWASSPNGASAEASKSKTHRGSRAGKGRRRTAATPTAKPEARTEDEKPASASTATRAKPAPRKKPTRSTASKPRATAKRRTPSQPTSPRPKIPVTGAPSGEVPAPFAHNAEYEFARILDFYGIEWQYEPRTFPLRYERGHVSEAFSPDFYLPDLNLYVELTTVKPNLTQEKNRKMRLLQEMYPEVNIMLLKKRDYLRLLSKYGYGPLRPDQVPEVGKVLFTATKIQRRVGELGAEISRDYADSEPVLVGVLRGVMCFMPDLMRNISVPTSVDFMAISSYEGNGAAAVRILKDLDENIKGKDVILVEDIVDTGMTLNHVIEYLQTKRPRSVKVCTLLDKRARRLANVELEYVGFQIPDEFVVGYGLDFRQRFRNLPFIGTLKHQLLP